MPAGIAIDRTGYLELGDTFDLPPPWFPIHTNIAATYSMTEDGSGIVDRPSPLPLPDVAPYRDRQKM